MDNKEADQIINFNKPQDEMFKQLDGKLERLVAAHSSLNKLFILNDFSVTGHGPKMPFELPPQLPPPPPFVPKPVTTIKKSEELSTIKLKDKERNFLELIKQQIAAVTQASRQNQQSKFSLINRPLLLENQQSLIAKIEKDTNLLLNKQSRQSLGSSLLSNKPKISFTMKIVIPPSKYKKDTYPMGLKISNYQDKEWPQPTNESITQDQFAKYLNLIRPTDAMLLKSDNKRKLPIGRRPLRLARFNVRQRGA